MTVPVFVCNNHCLLAPQYDSAFAAFVAKHLDSDVRLKKKLHKLIEQYYHEKELVLSFRMIYTYTVCLLQRRINHESLELSTSTTSFTNQCDVMAQ